MATSVLDTGADSGIGLVTVLELAGAGYGAAYARAEAIANREADRRGLRTLPITIPFAG